LRVNGREVVGHFRSGAWKSPEEIDAFLAGVDDIQPPDVLKLLEMLGSRGGASDGVQRMRCLAFARLVEKAPDRSLFVPFVKALKTSDPQVRAVLAPLLVRVNSVSDHAALCALLRSAEAPLRQVAAQVLSQIGGKSVFDSLGEMIPEPGFPGRMEAMEVLVKVAPQHAVPALRSVLSAGTPQEKIRALGHLCEPRCMARDPGGALDAVASALGDPSEAVAVQAVSSFSAACPEDEYFRQVAPLLDSPNLNLVKAAVEGLRRFGSPRAIAALSRKLRTGPNVIRFAVIDVFEAIGSPEVLNPLVEALGHNQLAVRTRAGEALSRLSRAGKLELARAIIWLLRSRDVNVRRMAVEVAQSVRDPTGELWPKLLGYLRDEDWWVRERVMDALVDMAGPQLVRHVVGYLQDPSDLVRRFGVDALMRLKAPESLGALLRTAASDPDWWVRERAIETVAILKDPRAVPHLVDIMGKNPHLQVACLNALGELEARAAAPHAAALLGSEDPDVHLAALRCLKAINDPAQGAAVRPLLKDHRTEVRGLARELLNRWKASTSGDVPLVQSADQPTPMLDQLLIAVAKMDGDDLILSPGRRPFVKRFGKTLPLAKNVFSAERVRALLTPHLTEKQIADLDSQREVDFSYRVSSEALRFRVNVFQQLGGVSAVFRIIKGTLPEIEKLGLPPVVLSLAELQSGLVLVGGPTGAGKSTTLAALIDYINRTSKRHIISLEDPIEVVHERKQSLVNQRELGTHTRSFAQALRSTLREDPDVILIGEMRDFPTISFAVSAAETGHLVFGTVHTVSAAGTMDRLINAFPAGQQDHARSLLAGSLRAVVCQFLHRRRDGPGRCLSVEVMLNNEAVANLIRKAKTFQIPSVIATSREAGMQLMDAELLRLHKEGKISAEDAYAKAASKKDFEALIAPPAPKGPAAPPS
jgi:twitching motility protein PilT